jgi:hypothetical protein
MPQPHALRQNGHAAALEEDGKVIVDLVNAGLATGDNVAEKIEKALLGSAAR